jgi:hypothetical protein
MHPWEDPDLMPLYHVQLETRDLIVSYEVATDEYDAADLAIQHLKGWKNLQEDTPIWKTHISSIGYHPIGGSVVVKWEITGEIE